MQTEMNKLFAEGGVMQDGGTVDPVSGNEVPPGAMQEEVRDDIDAKLSEGEFVFPADVVRFYGLEKLMMMRDKAKKGLERMNEIGQMGNAEEVPDGEALFGDEMDDDAFSSEIDSIMSEDSGGEEREYAKGGDVRKYAPGGYVGGEENAQLYRDAPIKGFEMVPMTNDAGQTIYIPFINGVAQLSIPSGYKVKKAGDVAKPEDEKPVETAPTTGGDGGGGGGDGPTSSPVGSGGLGTFGMGDVSISPEGVVSGGQVSSKGMMALGAIVGSILGVGPVIGAQAAKSFGKSINASNAATIAAAQASINDTMGVNATNVGGGPTAITAEEAGKGVEGVTGGSAAAAASAAASAAAAQGMSAAAQGAASQAAASATLGGASASEAAQAGQNAAAAVDQGDVAEGGAIAAEANNTATTSVGNASDPDGTVGGGGTTASDGVSSDGVSGVSADGIGFAKGGFASKRKDKKTGKSTSFVTRQK